MSATSRIVSTDLAHKTSIQRVIVRSHGKATVEQAIGNFRLKNITTFPISLIASWRKNRIAQRELRHLLERAPDHILSDVGLSAKRVEDEIKRLRWNPFKQQ